MVRVGAGDGEVSVLEGELAEVGDEILGIEEMMDGVEVEGQPGGAEEHGGEQEQPAGPSHR